MKSLHSWVQKNILKYTVVVSLIAFLIGPFLQSASTEFLQKKFRATPISILICTPIQNVIRIVTSHNGKSTKIHSANRAPFLQEISVIVTNHSGKLIKGSKLFVVPVNYAKNQISSARFVTDNNIEGKKIAVTRSDDNKFYIDIGTFYDEQTIVLNFYTLFPTSVVIEYGGEGINYKKILNSGNCDKTIGKHFNSIPVGFFDLDLTKKKLDTKHAGKIDDIVAPIGPLAINYLFEFNCGEGIRRLKVPMNGSFSICNMHINSPKK